MIDAEPHDAYAEPFVGMGGVFLRRTRAPVTEIINDFNRDIATVFRVLQRHHSALITELRWSLTSRAEFERLLDVPPDTLTDLERASRFLYLQRLGFGGKVAGRTFGVDRQSTARFNSTRLVSTLEAIHKRLAGVWIDCLPWCQFIDRWDRPGALFYLDPPYWGTEGAYGHDLFGRDDFERLAARLRTLRGRFILSVNDVPELRMLFAWARVDSVEIVHRAGAARTGGKAVRELIVRPS